MSGLWFSIEQMLRLYDFWFDKSGDLLFPDLPQEQYLSVYYMEKDIARLMEYGLCFMTLSDMIARARMDL